MTITSLLSSTSSVVGGIAAFGAMIGAYIAGRRGYSKELLEKMKTEADGWHRLYAQEKETNSNLTSQIAALVAEGHAKDNKISELTGRLDVIERFVRGLLSKDAVGQIIP